MQLGYIALLLLAAQLHAQSSTSAWGITAEKPILSGNAVQTVIGSQGSVYLAGEGNEFAWPAPTNSYGDTSHWVNYIARFDSNGVPIFSTAIGGTYLMSIATDAAGDIFASGTAANTGFPVTPGVYQTSSSVDGSAFACKLSGLDGQIVFCTYVDQPLGNVLAPLGPDLNGNLVIVAEQAGRATAGSVNLGSNNISVAKLSGDGTKLLYLAEFGGSVGDSIAAAALDQAGNVIVTGQTYSFDYPVTSNAADKTFSLTIDGSGPSFVTQLSADGTSLLYSTLGQPGEQPQALAIDAAGEAEILYIGSKQVDSVRRYSGDGSAILFDTSLGINQDSPSYSIMAIDSLGVTTVLGYETDIGIPLLHPVQSCQFTSLIPGSGNGFMVRLNDSGSIQQSTFLQGSGSSTFAAIAVTSNSSTAAVWSADGLAVQPELELLTLAAGAPDLQLSCLGNAATFQGAPLAPGEIITLFGQQIGPATAQSGAADSTGHFPTNLGNTEVTFDGAPVPLLYVSSGQINAVVPFEAQNSSTVCVLVAGQTTNCIHAGIAPASPGIFVVPSPYGTNQYAAAINQDGTVNSQQNPAQAGSIVSFYATGLGTVTPSATDGKITGLPLETQALNLSVLTPQNGIVNVGLKTGCPVWAGQAPFEIAGLSQVNVQIDGQNVFAFIVFLPDGTARISNTVQIWVQ